METRNRDLSNMIGNVKRKFSNDDFNPYQVMSFIYDNILHRGPHEKVLIIGYTERFRDHILKSWWHVLAEKGLIKNGDKVPIPIENELITHTGTVLKFVNCNIGDNYNKLFTKSCKEATTIVLCNSYKNPLHTNVLRSASLTKKVLDFSCNNMK